MTPDECWLCRDYEELGEKCPLHCPCSTCRRNRGLFARALRLGLSRGLELAKEHASAVCCHECRECDGEGYVDNEETDADDDCPQCEGKGDRLDKVEIDWSKADDAIAKEGK